jgi:hypothetical protein
LSSHIWWHRRVCGLWMFMVIYPIEIEMESKLSYIMYIQNYNTYIYILYIYIFPVYGFSNYTYIIFQFMEYIIYIYTWSFFSSWIYSSILKSILTLIHCGHPRRRWILCCRTLLRKNRVAFGAKGLIYVWRIMIPSGYVKIAIENDHRNSGFSH